jgi:polysaccharide export outer membrane protein
MKTSSRSRFHSHGKLLSYRVAVIACIALGAVAIGAHVLVGESPVRQVQTIPMAGNQNYSQGLSPAAPYPICGVDCFGPNSKCRICGDGASWENARFIAWQQYAQGEYVGRARTEHVSEYRLRPDDQLEVLFRLTRDEKLTVGDAIKVESFTDAELNRELLIQPDGSITLRLLGQVHATNLTVAQLRDVLEDMYKKYYRVPAITVTPLRVNTQLEDLRAVIDRRAGVGGQELGVKVTPEGTIALPAVGNVKVQGLSLEEAKHELNERYREKFEGIEITPTLAQRASRYVYVIGEVHSPGRYELLGPTTILQSIAMAGSWNVGANIAQVVVFRRGDDWRLMATMVNLEGALRGKSPCPRGEIWIGDSDVIIVPKTRILEADDFINLVFTRGIYGVFPLDSTISFTKLKTI